MMGIDREKVLIEGGIRSACHKAGKLAIKGERVTRKLFEDLVIQSTRLEISCCNCPSLMYIEHSHDLSNYYIIVKVTAQGGHCLLCSFDIQSLQGKHFESLPIVTNVKVGEWEYDEPICSIMRNSY